jgi:hypothetical protein
MTILIANLTQYQISTDFSSFCTHFLRYYLLRNAQILPFHHAIKNNSIQYLDIHEPLTNLEWRSLATLLTHNSSVISVDFSSQIIAHELIHLTFQSLINNQLTELILTDCHLFVPIDCYSKQRVRLSAILVEQHDKQLKIKNDANADQDLPRVSYIYICLYFVFC